MVPERSFRYVKEPAGLAELVVRLRSMKAIALDTESNSFHAYFERVCLIQLSTLEEDIILDPLHLDVRPLGEILANPEVEVVAHGADYDVRTLRRDFGFQIANLFDTMLAARLLGRRELGLANLVRQHFGVELQKGNQRSDWGRRPLTGQQLAYAATDTRYLLALRELLGRELESAGRQAEARAIFLKQSRCEARPKQFDPHGWRRIRGVRELDARGRSTARELYVLREELARSSDRPPFKIYGDETLVELSRAAPRSLDELSRVRGLGASALHRFGRAVLDAMERAANAAGADAAAVRPPRGGATSASAAVRSEDRPRPREPGSTTEPPEAPEARASVKDQAAQHETPAVAGGISTPTGSAQNETPAVAGGISNPTGSDEPASR